VFDGGGDGVDVGFGFSRLSVIAPAWALAATPVGTARSGTGIAFELSLASVWVLAWVSLVMRPVVARQIL